MSTPGCITPYPLAMVVCDFVWQDPGNGKQTILGTFSQIHCAEFPASHPVLCIYIEFTDGLGTMPVKLSLVDVDEENEPLYELETTVSIADPRAVIATSVILKNITFPEAGEYRIQLFVNSEFLIERRILVRQLEVIDQ